MEARRDELEGGSCVRVVGGEVEGDLEGEAGVGLERTRRIKRREGGREGGKVSSSGLD